MQTLRQTTRLNAFLQGFERGMLFAQDSSVASEKGGDVMSSKFSFKSFTTFILAWTFVVLILSGVMLFVSPPGRVAHWSNWTLGALTKEGWQEVHVLMAIVFLVGGLFHLLKFNWKVFTHYLKLACHRHAPSKGSLLSLGLLLLSSAGPCTDFRRSHGSQTGERR